MCQVLRMSAVGNQVEKKGQAVGIMSKVIQIYPKNKKIDDRIDYSPLVI